MKLVGTVAGSCLALPVKSVGVVQMSKFHRLLLLTDTDTCITLIVTVLVLLLAMF